MMALIHDHLTIIGDNIIDFILPNQALDHGDIQYSVRFILPCPDPSDFLRFDAKK